tara:strand:- start:33 stop:1547 length:1515 start_codon:yes stop_codon:yes gene_type:complete
MPYQDNEPIPENYKRDWVSNETQRVDGEGNKMFEERKTKKALKLPPVPILNFPAGGYWKYSIIDPDGPQASGSGDPQDNAPVFHKVPEVFTHFTKQKDYLGKAAGFKGVKQEVVHSREHLRKLIKDEIQAKFEAFNLEQFSDEEEMSAFEQEVDDDWNRGAMFEGGAGFIATKTQDGGALPGSLMDTAPVGYYWKQDAEGNDVWKDGKRVRAPLYEGKGLTRAGKVATHLATYGRGGMYGGEENIKKQLEETYVQNNTYIGQLARKYTPDITGANTIPAQTAAGQEDELRADGTKLTRDYTAETIGSINPSDYTIGDPLLRWAQSSEAKAIEVEREREFNALIDKEYQAEVEQFKGTPLEGKAIPWTALGIKYGGNAYAMNVDWERAKGAKRELYALYEAQYQASIKPALDEPDVDDIAGLAVQMNGVILDDRGRPTGEVVAAPQDDLDSDEDIDDWFAEGGSDEEINVVSMAQDEDEFQDDGDTYGRRITSGQGKQLRWDAGK